MNVDNLSLLKVTIQRKQRIKMSLKNYPPPRSTGIRDDLEFLLEKDLSSVQLCALHMEMRNTKQLLGSIGLVAHKIDCHCLFS